MYYLYILYSPDYDKYYVGQTNDIERRLFEHNHNPRMTYTHKFRPWVLKCSYMISENRGDVIRIERYIKRQKSRKILEDLIQDSNYIEEIKHKVLKTK